MARLAEQAQRARELAGGGGHPAHPQPLVSSEEAQPPLPPEDGERATPTPATATTN